jgi:flagellar assembly factor FliW
VARTRAEEGNATLPATTPPLLHFAAGLPGFPDLRRFALVRWGDEGGPLSLLRSVERPEIEFVVVPPAIFFPDYAPEIDDVTAERLGLRDADDALVLVILTVADRPADTTANLLGPVVVNQHTLEAAQVVLAGSNHQLRAPLAHT